MPRCQTNGYYIRSCYYLAEPKMCHPFTEQLMQQIHIVAFMLPTIIHSDNNHNHLRKYKYTICVEHTLRRKKNDHKENKWNMGK